MATLKQLEDELIALVQTVPAFLSNSFSIFNLDDLSRISGMQGFPLAAVGYSGSEPVAASTSAAGTPSANMVDVQFVVIVAVEYNYGSNNDTKPTATGLLGDIRPIIAGHKGVNSRPWRFIREYPVPDVGGDGVIFYSQVWKTVVPLLGN